MVRVRVTSPNLNPHPHPHPNQAFYKQANALCEDPASRRGYTRVQAKVHPDVEWVPQPEGPGVGDGALGGFARARKSVNLDELPPGPR